MTGYAVDRSWSDAFVPALRYIVGPLLVEESTLKQDCEQAADLVVFTARSLTIACRVRRPGFAVDYPWDFTIRSKRGSGIKTELSKIVDGWADWFIYGHSAEDQISLARWMVLDLQVFRAAMIRSEAIRKRRQISNGDGTWFIAYDVRDFPKPIIIAAKPTL